MNHPIAERLYFAARLETLTPLSISSGKGINTDSDVLRDGEGRPFIPGTSAAGVIRDYLKQKKNEPGMMGYADGQDGRMSSLFISDMSLEGDIHVTKRDGVRLTAEKTVEPTGKFDMEIVEQGLTTVLYIEAVRREGDALDYKREIEDIVQAIDDGDIRFGAKKNRGFGWMKVRALYERSFTSENGQQWLTFVPKWKTRILDSKWRVKEFKRCENRERYLTFRVPLRQEGCISIRTYSALKGAPDFTHITSNGEPVIPGSSFNGVIRARAREILLELGVPENGTDRILKEWFGSAVNVSGKEKGRQSRIVYRECRIVNAKRVQTTRNKIDRFSMATVSGALYTEASYASGTTELMMKLKRDEYAEAAAGLLMLIFDELKTGYLAVGGETAIGHGIFKANGETDESYGSGLDRTVCLKALYNLIRSR